MEKQSTSDTDKTTTNTRHPIPDNQKLTATIDIQQPTIHSQHLTADTRQLTTNNKQLPPTDTTDIQRQHPTTDTQ
jgi:hypothetical protein